MMARSARSCDTAQVVLKVDNLCKRFGGLVAVDNLSFAVYKGQIMGIIGPNGAGKTTAFNLISGVSSPTCGDISLCENRITGFPSHQVALLGLRRTFQEIHLFRGLTVLQNVKSAAFHQMDYSLADALAWSRRLRTQERDVTARSMELLERFGLAEMANEPADSLPYGMQKRLEIVKAIVTNPKVLLLDEPASGLDPRARIEIKELLKELKSMGKTIIISSHILPELADFCNKIGIIEKGKLIISGGVQEIMRQVSGGRVLLLRVLDEPDRVIELLSAMEGVLSAGVDEGRSAIRIEFAGDEAAQHAILQQLIQNGIRVQSFNEVQTDLEEIFMKVTRGIVS